MDHPAPPSYIWPPQTNLLCRVCLRSDPVARLSLFECTIAGRLAADVLSVVGGIPVPPADDRFPRVACYDCFQRLEAAFGLREMVQASNRKLVEMLVMGGVGGERVVAVKQELGDAAGTSGSTIIVKNYVITKAEVQSPDNDNELQTVVKTEPLDEDEELTSDEDDEDETPDIKEEITVEEPRLEDPEETASDSQEINTRSFFEELPVQPTECCGCRLNCASLEELQVHFRTVHAPMRTPKADIKKGLRECKQCFKLIKSIKGHRPKSLRCKICGEMVTKWYGATMHYKSKHGPGKSPEPKICCGCQERFQTHTELKAHANLAHFPNRLPPDEKRPFVCEICYKNYPDHIGLHQHQRRLAKDTKPHQCGQCERSFFFLNALRDHELSHTTAQKTLACPKCPAAFITQHSLRKHIARHDQPADKFQCATCRKCFKSQKALREHNYVHTGERPHKCTHCEASFSRYDCYKTHVRSMHRDQSQEGETEPEVHECKVCGKTFRLVQYLVRHTRAMHEGKSKPFPCELCSDSFVRKEGLENHVKRVHPGGGAGDSGNELIVQ
uniref:Putative malate dehydrogenase n=1 Tax=Culex tarsalis TaxID=7177 RepID=A0A1Q3F1Z3_CULTA